jgi:hypothetical protein
MTRLYLLFHKDLAGCFETGALSRAMIEAVHGQRYVLFGDGIEAHLVGEELADDGLQVGHARKAKQTL